MQEDRFGITDILVSRPAVLTIPLLNVTVPAWYNNEGRPFVAISSLCRALDLQPDYEKRRLRRILLGHHTQRFSITHNGQQYGVWCLDYPLSVTYWLSTVADHVAHEERRHQIYTLVEYGIELGGAAQELVHQEFLRGRQRIYQLAAQLSQIDTALPRFLAMLPRFPLSLQERGWELDRQIRVLIQEASTFITTWLAKIAELPVANVITLTADGTVDERIPSSSMTLLAVMSKTDEATLGQYERHLQEWLERFLTLLQQLDQIA